MREFVIEVSVMIAIGVVLAALGPFGSYAIGDFADRLAYWLPAALLGYAIYRPATFVMERLVARLRLPLMLGLVATVLIAGIPGTIVVAMMGGYGLGELPGAKALFPLYVNVVILGGMIMGMFVLLDKRNRRAPVEEPPDATASAPRPPFHDRLSPGFAFPLLALEMEDHYVRAHGRDGRSELILLRMRDAVSELGEGAGERVHRSWWVAREAISGKRRDGRNLLLRLSDGREVPVARDRVGDLKAKGWL